MKATWQMWDRFGLREEEDDFFDSGSGGADDSEVDNDDAGEENEDGTEEEGDEPTEPQHRGASADEIATAVTTALASQNRGQAPQMSDAEIKKYLQHYAVGPDLIKSLRNPEMAEADVVPMLQSLVDGTARHAMMSMMVAMDQKLKPLQQGYESYNSYRQQQNVREFHSNILKNNPALSRFGHVVTQAIQEMKAEGYRHQSDSKSKKDVALRAQAIIRKIDPHFSLKQNGQPQQRQASSFVARRSGGRDSGFAPQGGGVSSFKDLF